MFSDNWGVVGLEPSEVAEVSGLHPSKDVDFNIYVDEDTGQTFITFYGWDAEHDQIDTSNVIGRYELNLIAGKKDRQDFTLKERAEYGSKEFDFELEYDYMDDRMFAFHGQSWIPLTVFTDEEKQHIEDELYELSKDNKDTGFPYPIDWAFPLKEALAYWNKDREHQLKLKDVQTKTWSPLDMDKEKRILAKEDNDE